MSNEKSKMILAIIAVAMMVGVALTPLAYEPAEGAVATTTTDDKSTGVTLEEILNALMKAEPSVSLEVGNYMLVPVDEEVGDPAPIVRTNPITKTETFTGDHYLKGDYTFGDGSYANNGHFVFKSGSTLVFQPEQFSITCKNEWRDDIYSYTLIILETGAKISAFGLTYKVFAAGTNGAAALILTNNAKASFTYTVGSDNKLHLEIGVANVIGTDKDRYLCLFDGLNMYSGSKIIVDGKFVYEDNKAKFTDCTLDIEIVHLDYTYIIKTGTEKTDKKSSLTMGLVSSDVSDDEWNATLSVSADIHFATFDVYRGDKNSKIVGLTDTSLSFDNLVLKVTEEKDAETGNLHSEYNVKSSYGIDLTISKVVVNPAKQENTKVNGEMNGLVVKIKNLDVTLTTEITPTTLRALASANGSLDISASAKTLNLKGIAGILEINAKNITVDLSNFKVNYSPVKKESTSDANKTYNLDVVGDLKVAADRISADIEFQIFEITIGMVDIDGFELALNSFEGKYGPDSEGKKASSLNVKAIALNGTIVSELFVYSPTISLTVKNFAGTSDMDFKGDVELDLSVKFDGIDRHLTLDCTKVHYWQVDSGKSFMKNYSEVKKISFSNDIPMSKVIPDLLAEYYLYNEDFILQFTASDISYKHELTEEKRVSGEAFSMVWYPTSCGVSEKVTLNIDSHFDASLKQRIKSEDTHGHTGIELETKKITGTLKNISDAEGSSFTIKGKTDTDSTKVVFYYSKSQESYKGGPFLEIETGKAEFGKGLLPCTLVVDENVSFTANGLSAFHFRFKTTDLKGTVSFDLADKVPLSMRAILFGNDYDKLIDLVTTGGDLGGYVVTYDFESKRLTFVANDGWEFVSGKGWESYESKKATIIYNVAKLALGSITTSDFRFSYEGDKDTEKKVCGATIELRAAPTVIPEGKIFVGWSDGEKTYAAESDYTMPAKTVVMKAVYADKATAKTSGESIVVETDSNKSVAVMAGELGAGDKDVIFKVSGMSVTMDKDTVSTIIGDMEDDSYLVLSAVKVTDIVDPVTKKIVGDNSLYEISLFAQSDDTITPVTDFSSDTSFKVTLNLSCDSDKYLKSVGVKYIIDGHVSSVAIDEVKKNDDGTYSVTFTVNHFSEFVLEPEFGTNPTPAPETESKTYTAALVAVLVVILAVIAFAAIRLDRH